jgi:acetoin utilization deacetylase AcuC-like enzyme
MHAYYADHFVLPLPKGHRFPMAKYAALRARVARELPKAQLCEPLAATDGELALAHTPAYIEQISSGTLSAMEQKVIGFPWSLAMVERSRRSTGASIGAARAVLPRPTAIGKAAAAVNLAGGTHHAFAGHGEGFCCFNDFAVAARLMQAERRAKRIAIVDLDVHQGNGTAAILKNDPSIFTLSMQGARNYPFRRQQSDLDVELPDGCSDGQYHDALALALAQLEQRFTPDAVFFLAGADVFAGDRLGRLKLSIDGIKQRDAMVFAFARRFNLPVVMAMGGGYSPNIDEIVEIHFNSVKAAFDYTHGHENH